MSFFEAFRGFFGFPGRGRPRHSPFGGAIWDEEDEEDEASPGLAQPPRDFGFGFGPGGSRGALEELLRDMSEALGGLWAGPLQPFAPAPPAAGDASSPGQSLRDSMLKPWESSEPNAGTAEPTPPWRPCPGLEGPHLAPAGPKEDQDPAPPCPPDLDSEVSQQGLGSILLPEEPQSQSYFQSISVTRVTLPDGAVQELRTVQDSSGRRQTTLTRRGGQQEQEQEQGRGHREELLGRDQRELAQFVGTWAQQEELQGPRLSHSAPSLGSFFRLWFSSW